MVLLLEASYRYVLQTYITQGVAEAEPHGADVDWRPVLGNRNPSQFGKARKPSPTLRLLPHFAFLQPHAVCWALCALSCFLRHGMRAIGPILQQLFLRWEFLIPNARPWHLSTLQISWAKQHCLSKDVSLPWSLVCFEGIRYLWICRAIFCFLKQ